MSKINLDNGRWFDSDKAIFMKKTSSGMATTIFLVQLREFTFLV